MKSVHRVLAWLFLTDRDPEEDWPAAVAKAKAESEDRMRRISVDEPWPSDRLHGKDRKR